MKQILCGIMCLSLSILFSQNRDIAIDTTVTTSHSVTIDGKNIPYLATAGTQPVWNEKGEPIDEEF